jgi:diacylglycerol O-acyltransferase-1
LSDLPDLSKFSLDTWEQFPFLTGILLLQLFLVAAFVIEWFLARKRLFEPVGMILHQINAHCSLAVCIFIVWNFIDTPYIGGCLLLNAAITWMKLISYALANQDYRLSANQKDGDAHQLTLAIIDNLDSDDLDIEYPRYVFEERDRV